MTANIEAEIYIALRDHLKTYTDAPFTVFPMDKADPPVDAGGLHDIYWIVDDMRLPVSTRFAGDNDPDEYRGNFQISIMFPNRITQPQLMYQVGLLASHFPKLTDIWLSTGRLQIRGTPYLATTPYKDGVYYRAPVLVPWRLSAKVG